jgi:hypothetical protein
MVGKANIILFSLFSLILLMSFVSAGWNYYGGVSWNALTEIEGKKGIFNQGVNQSAYNSILGTNFFPLIANFSNVGGEDYVIITKGNYLYLLEPKSLSIEKEYFIGGTQQSDISTADFDNDEKREEVAGIFNIAGIDKFLVFKYNITSQNMTKIYELNLSSNIQSGIKCGHFLDLSTTDCVFGESSTSAQHTNLTFINISTTSSNIQTCFFRNATIYPAISNPSISYIEGTPYFLFYYGSWSSNNFIDAVNKNCVSLFNKTYISSNPNYYSDVVANWYVGFGETKIAYTLFYYIFGGFNCNAKVILSNLDGNDYWTKQYWSSSDCSNKERPLYINTYGDTFNEDVYWDIWLLIQENQKKYIFNGFTGDILSSTPDTKTSSNTILADMNNNDINDWIMGGMIRNSQTNTTIADVGSWSWCIPYDIVLDNYLDLICSKSTKGTAIFVANYTNQNVVIQSVTYDTGMTIQVNSTLFMYVTATDVESNPIYCSVNCYGNNTWTSEAGTTLSCYYNQLGQFNNTIRCRDFFHSTYDYFSQIISVTQTGIICNNNNICDSIQGETYINCPNDCKQPINYTQATETGGIPIPLKIVDTENTEQGLLPEIYYGTLGFLSNTLSPMIILIFAIFFALIILSIGFIIKKVAHRVGDLAG